MGRWNTQVHRIPLPLATGGIGLILALLLPVGLSGGRGFLVGFLIGADIVLIEVVAHSKAKQTEAKQERVERHQGDRNRPGHAPDVV